MNFLIILLFFFYLKSCNNLPILGNNGEHFLGNIMDTTTSSGSNLDLTPPEILKFMKRFGYIDSPPSTDLPDAEAIYQEGAIADAIKNIQKFGNLNQSGILDNATLKLMISPRCGVPDLYSNKYYNNEITRKKRYVVGGQRWLKRNIKYFIANWSPKIGENEVAKHMKRVFDVWGSYSNLKFKRIYDNSADIIIAFGSRYHGDNYLFDGPGNILAHAFYPYESNHYGGDIHFDNDENWKENSTNLIDGVDFFSVALHELGHSLGLAHSHVYSSIMFPYYKGPDQANLDYDDIIAMYKLYIQGTFIDDNWTTEATREQVDNKLSTTTPIIPTATVSIFKPTYEGDYETVEDHLKRNNMITPPTISQNSMQTISTPIPKVIPNICEGSFDAVGVLKGNPYIFKGDYIWKLTENYKIAEGYPIDFHEMFNFIPDDINRIDAAYERSYDNALVLFSGKNVWVYDGKKLIENSPRLLTDYEIPENVTHINAAMYWPKNQKTYIFGTSVFWRYDDNLQKLNIGYPKAMSKWIGIPENIDAAITIPNGKTYFFKENIYWLYNNIWIRPESGYPRRASSAWLGCPLPQRKPYRNINNNYENLKTNNIN